MAAEYRPVVGNQHFVVYFGKTRISFSKVRNLQHTAEHETLSEGGLNDFVHVLNRPGSQGGTLTLEKGVMARADDVRGIQALAPGRRIQVPVTITLYHWNGSGEWKPVRAWGVQDGVVTRWELTELDGLGSSVALETLEIAHSGLIELEV